MGYTTTRSTPRYDPSVRRAPTEHAPRRLESRRRARIQAKKAAAAARGLAQQSIDNSLQEGYLSPVRTPNDWFQTHLDLINIGYSRTGTSWCSAVEEQFLWLQGVLLELADLSVPELRSDQLDATQFVHDPGSSTIIWTITVGTSMRSHGCSGKGRTRWRTPGGRYCSGT